MHWYFSCHIFLYAFLRQFVIFELFSFDFQYITQVRIIEMCEIVFDA